VWCPFSCQSLNLPVRLQRSIFCADPVSRPLLPVIYKNPVACSRELCTILLEASQNGKITLINYLATITRDITNACCLLIYLAGMLGNGPGRKEDKRQSDDRKNFSHGVPRVAIARERNGYDRASTWFRPVETPNLATRDYRKPSRTLTLAGGHIGGQLTSSMQSARSR
jgi:hypothetical protein